MKNNSLTKYLQDNDIDVPVILPGDSALEKYTHFERGRNGTPALAFKPQNENQIQTIIKLLNEHKSSAVIFAGNTGLVSAQRAQEQAVIDLNDLDNLTSITLKNGDIFKFSKLKNVISKDNKAEIWREELHSWIKEKSYVEHDFLNAEISCQAAIPVGTINYVLQQAGVEIPIDTGAVGTGWGMTAGAGAANASHGSYGLMHGTMCDLVIETKAINGDGTLRTDKGNAGNAINILESETVINSARAQFGDSSLGTQGTFALITNVKLSSSPVPKQSHFFLLKTENVSQVNEIREKMQEQFPNNVRQFEIMNKLATEIVRQFEADNFTNPFYKNGAPVGNSQPINSNYLTMIELIDFEESSELGIQAYEFIISNLNQNDETIAYAGDSGSDPKKFIKMRHSISEASTTYANNFGNANFHRITPDVSVPLNTLDKYIDELTKKLETQNYQINIFGHIGVGAFHLHVYSEAKLTKDIKTELIKKIYSITTKHNGSCWSEHGIGTANADLYQEFTPQKYIDEWLGYVRKYDPNNVLNSHSNNFDKM